MRSWRLGEVRREFWRRLKVVMPRFTVHQAGDCIFELAVFERPIDEFRCHEGNHSRATHRIRQGTKVYVRPAPRNQQYQATETLHRRTMLPEILTAEHLSPRCVSMRKLITPSPPAATIWPL